MSKEEGEIHMPLEEHIELEPNEKFNGDHKRTITERMKPSSNESYKVR